MQTGGRGLSSQEAKQRLEQHGPNALSKKKGTSAVGMFLAQFKDLMIIILAIATVLSALLGETTEAITIIAIVLLNAVMGFVQEYRTEKTLEALNALSAPVAKAWRDGQLVTLPAEELVPGDLLALTAGDRIPADAEAAACVALSSDESIITGESVPVAKKNGGKLYMGATVAAGHCEARVTATGMDTEMGRIAGMLEEHKEEKTPLQQRLDELGKFVAVACIVVCLAVSAIGYFKGESLMNMILTGISLSVAAIPEGMPAIVTIVLALSVGRILKKGAVIRKLHAVETLGSAGVICTDKTGTLTQNKMTVKELYCGGRGISVGGDGYAAQGSFSCAGKYVDAARDPLLGRLFTVMALCTEARATLKKDRYEVQGDPTETALLVAAGKAGVTREKLLAVWKLTGERPFDSARKMMSVTARGRGGELLLCKGAPDVLLGHCSRVALPGGSRAMTAADRREIENAAEAMAKRALRVIGLAESPNPGAGEKDLVFLGLAGMIDPPRPEVAPAVRQCRRAGIKPVMITGDHKDTAAAIAREVGILRPGDEVLTGAEIEKLTDAELAAKCRRVSVYARVSPAHKLRIVKAWKAAGKVVAMTGDGVNDAPAVKAADIGVAMGISGTDVTKEAASVVILDDNFATIVSSVEEGRVIYQNIRSFIRYLLTCNLGEVLSMLFSMMLGAPVALLPIQILMVNLLTDGLPAIALGMEPPSHKIMEKPPRPKNEGLFAHGLMATIIVRGIFLGACTSGSFYAVYQMSGGDIQLARSAGYLVLVLSQMVHIFECRGKGFSFIGNPYLIFASLVSVSSTLLTVYLPVLQPIFRTTAVGPEYALPVLAGIFAGPVLFFVLRKVWHLLRRGRRAS